MTELERFRMQIDEFFGRHPQSPLDNQQKRTFKGLNYYRWNPDLIVRSPVEPFPDASEIITMQTSTGDVAQFVRFGLFQFAVDGVETTLTIFSNQAGDDLFLPFKDTTNGDETYGAGRYIDTHRPGIRHLSGTVFEIDFNYSYSPFCAFSPYFSCPLPPRENWLQVPIRAGEKL